MTKTAKRVLDAFEISELSAVDRPAQVHAKMSLIKSESGEPSDHLMAELTKAMAAQHQEEANENRKDSDMSIATTKNDAVSFSSLEEAMAHLQAQGMSHFDAMQKAARAHPDLLAKFQGTPSAEAQAEAEHIEKCRQGAARRAQIAALVDATALAKGCSRTDAIRMVRRTNSELFAADE